MALMPETHISKSVNSDHSVLPGNKRKVSKQKQMTSPRVVLRMTTAKLTSSRDVLNASNKIVSPRGTCTGSCVHELGGNKRRSDENLGNNSITATPRSEVQRSSFKNEKSAVLVF